MGMIDKEFSNTIEKAIKNCYWHKDLWGVDMCGGMAAPCMRIIEKGQCDTIRKVIKEIKTEER